MRRYDAVLFDLLTALADSWSLWGAAAALGLPFDVVVTAERAGFYKPRPEPYRLALEELGLPAARVLFVAGSGFDLIGIAPPTGTPAPLAERRTLAELVPFFD